MKPSRYDDPVPTPEGGLYLRLKPNSSARLRIMTEPVMIHKVFKDDERPVTAWQWGVLDLTNPQAVTAKILEGKVSIFTQLRQLYHDEEWGDPTEYNITVERTGESKNDTKYLVRPGKRGPLPPELIKIWEDAKIELPEHGSTIRQDGTANQKEEYDQFADE